jgi:hypothetical protein
MQIRRRQISADERGARLCCAQRLRAEREAHARSREILTDRTIDAAVERALVAAGANTRTLPAARALLRKQWKFKVQDRDGVDAITIDSGEAVNLDSAVECWLASDAGEPFSTRNPSTTVQDKLRRLTR